MEEIPVRSRSSGGGVSQFTRSPLVIPRTRCSRGGVSSNALQVSHRFFVCAYLRRFCQAFESLVECFCVLRC